jgi:hypothetical protein
MFLASSAKTKLDPLTRKFAMIPAPQLCTGYSSGAWPSTESFRLSMISHECSTLSLRMKFIWLPSMASSTRKRLTQKQKSRYFSVSVLFDFGSQIQAGFIPPDISAFAFMLPRTLVRGKVSLPSSWASAQFLIFQLNRKTSTPIISSQNAIYQNLGSLRLGDKKPLGNYES